NDPQMILGIDHIQLAMPAGREDDARAFYGGLLGLTEVRKPPELARRGGVWFESPGAKIHLGVDPDFRPAKKAHPGLLVADFDDLAKRLCAAGVTIVEDDSAAATERHVYVHDPFGNRIELIEARSPAGEP